MIIYQSNLTFKKDGKDYNKKIFHLKSKTIQNQCFLYTKIGFSFIFKNFKNMKKSRYYKLNSNKIFNNKFLSNNFYPKINTLEKYEIKKLNKIVYIKNNFDYYYLDGIYKENTSDINDVLKIFTKGAEINNHPGCVCKLMQYYLLFKKNTVDDYKYILDIFIKCLLNNGLFSFFDVDYKKYGLLKIFFILLDINIGFYNYVKNLLSDIEKIINKLGNIFQKYEYIKNNNDLKYFILPWLMYKHDEKIFFHSLQIIEFAIDLFEKYEYCMFIADIYDEWLIGDFEFNYEYRIRLYNKYYEIYKNKKSLIRSLILKEKYINHSSEKNKIIKELYDIYTKDLTNYMEYYFFMYRFYLLKYNEISGINNDKQDSLTEIMNNLDLINLYGFNKINYLYYFSLKINNDNKLSKVALKMYNNKTNMIPYMIYNLKGIYGKINYKNISILIYKELIDNIENKNFDDCIILLIYLSKILVKFKLIDLSLNIFSLAGYIILKSNKLASLDKNFLYLIIIYFEKSLINKIDKYSILISISTILITMENKNYLDHLINILITYKINKYKKKVWSNLLKIDKDIDLIDYIKTKICLYFKINIDNDINLWERNYNLFLINYNLKNNLFLVLKDLKEDIIPKEKFSISNLENFRKNINEYEFKNSFFYTNINQDASNYLADINLNSLYEYSKRNFFIFNKNLIEITITKNVVEFNKKFSLNHEILLKSNNQRFNSLNNPKMEIQDFDNFFKEKNEKYFEIINKRFIKYYGIYYEIKEKYFDFHLVCEKFNVKDLLLEKGYVELFKKCKFKDRIAFINEIIYDIFCSILNNFKFTYFNPNLIVFSNISDYKIITPYFEKLENNILYYNHPKANENKLLRKYNVLWGIGIFILEIITKSKLSKKISSFEKNKNSKNYNEWIYKKIKKIKLKFSKKLNKLPNFYTIWVDFLLNYENFKNEIFNIKLLYYIKLIYNNHYSYKWVSRKTDIIEVIKQNFNKDILKDIKNKYYINSSIYLKIDKKFDKKNIFNNKFTLLKNNIILQCIKFNNNSDSDSSFIESITNFNRKFNFELKFPTTDRDYTFVSLVIDNNKKLEIGYFKNGKFKINYYLYKQILKKYSIENNNNFIIEIINNSRVLLSIIDHNIYNYKNYFNIVDPKMNILQIENEMKLFETNKINEFNISYFKSYIFGYEYFGKFNKNYFVILKNGSLYYSQLELDFDINKILNFVKNFNSEIVYEVNYEGNIFHGTKINNNYISGYNIIDNYNYVKYENNINNKYNNLIYDLKNDLSYHCNFKNNKRHGKGLIYYKEELILELNYKWGRIDGKAIKYCKGVKKGLLYYKNSIKIYIFFKNNNIILKGFIKNNYNIFGIVYNYEQYSKILGNFDINNFNLNGLYLINYSKNSYYFGKILNNEYNGNGFLKLEDNNKILGNFNNFNIKGKIFFVEKSEFSLAEGNFEIDDKINLNFKGLLIIKTKNNEIYTGKILNSKFNGYGKLSLTDKYEYRGNFKEGYFNGTGILKKENYVYKGFFSNHKKFGNGIIIFKNNNKFKGLFYNDKIKFVYKKNTKFSFNGIKNLKNVLYEINIDEQGNYSLNDLFFVEIKNIEVELKLEFILKNGQFDYGNIYFNNHLFYQGQLKDNNVNGIGKLYYPSGCNYIGNINDCQRDGLGKYNWGKVSYFGYFKKDIKDGFIFEYYNSKIEYFGYFKDDKKNGSGVLIEEFDKKIYQYYKNNVLEKLIIKY